MAKIALADFPCYKGNIRLENSAGDPVTADDLPSMTLMRREVAGRDGDGNRVFDWIDVATVDVISDEETTVIDDDLEMLQVRITALHPGEFVTGTAIAFTLERDNGDTDLVYRITEYESSPSRLMLVGRRVL